MCVGMNILQSREVLQKWKNKMTTSPRFEACVFIDEAYGINSPLAIINTEHHRTSAWEGKIGERTEQGEKGGKEKGEIRQRKWRKEMRMRGEILADGVQVQYLYSLAKQSVIKQEDV